MNGVTVQIATECAVCRQSLRQGCIYLCESELYDGAGSSERIIGWHPECCPTHIKERFDEIAAVDRENTG